MLRRPITTVIVLAAVVVLILAAPLVPVRGASSRQELPTVSASPEASPSLSSLVATYPDGVVLTTLAISPVADVPANPASIQLERLTLGPDEQVNQAPDGISLIAVETGTLTLAGAGLPAGSYGPGGTILLAGGEAADLAARDGEVTFLRARVTSDSQVAGSPPVTDALPEVLLAGAVRVPRGEATLALIRLEIAPGVDAGQRVFSGPMGLVVESGTLSVSDLEGRTTRVEAGSSLIAAAYTAHQIGNEGTEPVVGLAFGVLPTSPALAGAPVATPTPSSDVAATATIQALEQSTTDLLATVAAQDQNAAQLQATAEAQREAASGAISDAQATSVAIAVNAFDLSADLATASTRSDQAELNVTALQATVAAADARLSTVTAQQASLLATSEALEAAIANRDREVSELSTRVSGAEAAASDASAIASGAEGTMAAQAAAMQGVAATATAQALQSQALQGTLTANLAAAESTAAANLAVGGALGAAEATVAAQASMIAEMAAAPAPALNVEYVPVILDGDLNGLILGNQALRDEVVAEVRRQLQTQIEQQCVAGLVLSFGYAPVVNPGVELAQALNAVLVEDIPEVFGSAVTEDFAATEPPFGRAEVRVYFMSDCGTGASTTVSTPPPIVPSQ